MAQNQVTVLYLCPKCLEPSDQPTPCPKCGGKRIECRPGEPDDPCRKPLISEEGKVRSRAPIWWLERWMAEAEQKKSQKSSQ